MSLKYTQKLVLQQFGLCSVESVCGTASDRTLLSKPFPGHAQHVDATSELEVSVKQLICENQSLHIEVQANNEFPENSQQFQLLKNTFLLLSQER